MFIKFTGNLKKPKFLAIPWKAEVVDNKDPDKLGKVKIKVLGLIEGEVSDLPWAYPLNPSGLGGKPDSSSFAVPEIGSFIQVNFPYYDIYFPFYSGYWQDKTTHQPVFDEDYPESFGSIASDGFEFFHNKKTKITRFKLPGNTTITQTGTYTMNASGQVVLTADSNISIQAKGNVSVTADGKGTFSGKGGTTVGDGGSATKVQGSTVQIAGGGTPIAMVGSRSIGSGNHGAPVISNLIDGSSKITGA